MVDSAAAPFVKTPPVVPYSPTEFRDSTPSTVEATLFIRSLYDHELTDIDMVWRECGIDTNRSWVAARCAEERYARDLIDERTFDYLVRG